MATQKPPVSELVVFMFSLFIIRSGCQNLSYTESHNSSYRESYNSSYSKSHNGSYTESHNSSYSESYNSSYRKSHNGSYTESYNSSYDNSYTSASYNPYRPSTFQRSYDKDTLNVEERKALLTFIRSVNHSAQLINWNESEVACSWRGVTCDPAQTNVLYLRLPDMQLTGEIPNYTIGKLTNLRVLSLSFNNLSNEIPSDFSNLTYLTTLWLNNNNFSGQLPFITSKYLTSFNVSYNKLDSSIPYSLSKFPESAFFNNVYLCGHPFSQCNSSYPSTNSREQYKMPDDKREIVGVSLGSSLLFLILLCSVVKNIMYHPKKKKPTPSKASEIGRNNELVLFDDSDSFDLDGLLKEPTRVLGEGSVGTTLGVGANTTVIVKRLKHVMVTEQEFETKMEALGKMKNDNVVTLRGFCNYSEDEKWLIYDYMPAGSLSAHLHGSIGSDKTQLNWDHRIRIALSAAKGLAYLHRAKEVHGNIKPSNIFIRQLQETNFEASLSEYGLNTLFHGSSPVNHQDTSYRAPEVFQTREFTFASDVYSFGVLLLELFTRKTPFQASSGKEGVDLSKWIGSVVCEESKSELFDVELTRDHNVNKMVRLLQIVKACASIKPEERPSMDNVVMLLKQSMKTNVI